MSCLGADLAATFATVLLRKGRRARFVALSPACLCACLPRTCLLYWISTITLPTRSRREKAYRSLASVRPPWFAITWHRGAERCFEMSLHPFAGISDLAKTSLLRSSCTPYHMFLRGREYVRHKFRLYRYLFPVLKLN